MSAVRKTFSMGRDGSVFIWPVDLNRITRTAYMTIDVMATTARVDIAVKAAQARFDIELRASDYQDEVFRLGADLELNRSTP